jgi:hypothetical protein
MGHCHCSRCRKAHGTAFATFVSGAAERFRWRRGLELVHTFEGRPFCSVCSSATPLAESTGKSVFIPAGCLDDDPGCRPTTHIFVDSRANWDGLPEADGTERYAELPDDVAPPPVPARPPLPPASVTGALRGSCLCGASAFELTRPRALISCHCERCRKGRAAAHASNVFADAEGFRYLRGEENLRFYKVPEALRFGMTFCATCGSGLPRPPSGGPMVVVPAGVLDDDLPSLPGMHIFVGNKAPWHEIRDDQAQADEYPAGCASMFDWVTQQDARA